MCNLHFSATALCGVPKEATISKRAKLPQRKNENQQERAGLVLMCAGTQVLCLIPFYCLTIFQPVARRRPARPGAHARSAWRGGKGDALCPFFIRLSLIANGIGGVT